MADIIAEQNRFQRELDENGSARCPCCQRQATIWRMSVHSTLCHMLIWLYKESMKAHAVGSGLVHIEQFRPNKRTGNDFSIVKHWRLAEAKEAAPDEDKNSSGYWRLTSSGIDFVLGRIPIRKHLFIFDNKIVKSSDDQIFIADALGKKFSYAELMA